jgi:hypothetical protein
MRLIEVVPERQEHVLLDLGVPPTLNFCQQVLRPGRRAVLAPTSAHQLPIRIWKQMSDELNNFDSRHNCLRKCALQILERTAPEVWHARCLSARVDESKCMLKISIMDGRNQLRLILEGKLIGPWITELMTACETARADLHGRELVVDMNHLTAISHEGENALFELMKQGVKFRCRGVYAKQVLRQVARRASTSLPKTKT